MIQVGIMEDIPTPRPKGQVKEVSSWIREHCMENATSLENFPLDSKVQKKPAASRGSIAEISTPT